MYPLIIIKQIVVVLLIMFIIGGIVRNKHIVTRGLTYLIASLVLFAIGLVCVIYDLKTYESFSIDCLEAIVFGGTSFIFTIYGIILLSKKNKFAKKTKVKMVYTYHEKEEYVFLLYKHNEDVFINNTTNSGIIIKLRKKDFADDIITKVNKQYAIVKGDSFYQSGKLTFKGEKKDKLYYCYLIDIKNEILNNEFHLVNKYQISDLECEKKEKYIMIKLITEDNFEETI